jgi:hypothetical protein
MRPADSNLLYPKGKMTLQFFRDSFEKENEYLCCQKKCWKIGT